MKTNIKTKNALCGLLSGLLLLAAGTLNVQAAIITQSGVGLTGSGFVGGPGQSVTTSSGGPWADITFNFYNRTNGAPIAQGKIYVFGSPYLGTPQALSTSTPGLLGVAPAAGAVYSFPPSLVLLPNTQYFFYCDTRPGGAGGTTVTGNIYPGGTYLNSPNGNSDFRASLSADSAFSLQGTAINTPPNITFMSGSQTIDCTSNLGATSTVSINVNDAENNPLTVIWSINGSPVATHTLLGGTASDTLVAPFPFGTSTVSVSVTDGSSPPVTRSTTVTVIAHEAPLPSVASLPDLTGECAVTVTVTPTATDRCAEGGIVNGTTSDPLSYTAQGTYIITWTFTSTHDASLSSTQTQTVIVKDITPPTITCPPAVSVAFGAEPAAATSVTEFLAQGGTIEDNCDANGTVSSYDSVEGYCPTVITRSYVVKDAVGNASSCEQIITVNNLFAEDGILWLQPLARNGASSDTDPGADGTLKYRFKLGSTISIKVQAQSCDGNVSANANVIGKIVVFGDTDMDGVVDANEGAMVIDFNGVGAAGGVMDKVDGKLQFNLDTKKLIQTFKCYILQVTVTDSSTGESRVETLALQVK
jgi:hypothetical protein